MSLMAFFFPVCNCCNDNPNSLFPISIASILRRQILLTESDSLSIKTIPEKCSRGDKD